MEYITKYLKEVKLKDSTVFVSDYKGYIETHKGYVVYGLRHERLFEQVIEINKGNTEGMLFIGDTVKISNSMNIHVFLKL